MMKNNVLPKWKQKRRSEKENSTMIRTPSQPRGTVYSHPPIKLSYDDTLQTN